MSKQYMARNGSQQFKPSLEECQAMDENYEGFCLACGETQSGCEPDCRQYTCESCGKPKVYGGQELIMMGLAY